ncbi:hypothetical protein PR048_003960 [Dryococelus australis]|uniref:Mutator-like transposase domain-containing protein n=1 Tax=Dryococelus australis TaxID=614101 RepID=A0ABQ9I473_9NEOP|nr:hypothetical protein PR048_003960 [Dryococelus australis]
MELDQKGPTKPSTIIYQMWWVAIKLLVLYHRVQKEEVAVHQHQKQILHCLRMLLYHRFGKSYSNSQMCQKLVRIVHLNGVDAIVEGFPQSLSTYGFIYSRLIADGDSSVHRKLIDAMQYRPVRQVEKIECHNHICRTYSNKVRDACANTKLGNHELRSTLQARSMRLRTAVTSSIKFRKKQSEKDYYLDVEELRNDIVTAYIMH